MVFETLSSDPNTPESAFYAYQWLPPMAFMRATVFIVNASSRIYSIDLSNWHLTPLPEIFGWLILEWFGCLAGMYYIEKVFSVGYGVRSHPLFCLHGICLKRTNHHEASHKISNASDKIELSEPFLRETKSNEYLNGVDESNGAVNGRDVQEEAERVIHSTSTSLRVRVQNLRKEFPGVGGKKKMVAVHGLSIGVNQNECLGLLGPNGAGKTTAISMLCGLFEPTSGNALINGKSIKNTKELQMIHQTMGVCPQHDVLWSDLTAREHLLFYGRLKGLKGDVLEREVVEGKRWKKGWQKENYPKCFLFNLDIILTLYFINLF